jgi:hypothetical protein
MAFLPQDVKMLSLGIARRVVAVPQQLTMYQVEAVSATDYDHLLLVGRR